ncbi:MAG: hypothetical protein J6B45_00180 [Clostridia bacterium]|nr:hypothetical protein [Clostridia bacterium]
MKKILILLFVLILAFSLFACDDGETADLNNDKGENGENENLDKDTNDDGENDGQSQTGKPNGNGGLALAQAVIAQFENAASMKLEFSMDVFAESKNWHVDGNSTSYANAVRTFVVTIAKTNNGYNFKVDDKLVEREADGDNVKDIQGKYYFIDGVAYEYDMHRDVYVATVTEKIDTSEIEGLMAQLEESLDLTENDAKDILEALGAEFISVFNIVNGKGSVSANFKPVIDSVLGYVKELDVETKTVEGVINDILALVSDDLTVDMLVDEISATYAMTLEEYMEELDKSLVLMCGMTLQEMYEAIVTNEEFESYFAYSLEQSGMPQKEIEAYLESLAEFNINEAIPDEYKSMTMYEITLILIDSIYGVQEPDGEVEYYDGEEEEPPTLDEVVAMVKATLDMTLKEVENATGMPIARMIAVAKGTTIDAFDYKIDIELTDIFKIKSVGAVFNYGVKVSVPSEVEGKNDTSNQKMTVTIKLYDISDKTVEISVPADKEIVYNNSED